MNRATLGFAGCWAVVAVMTVACLLMVLVPVCFCQTQWDDDGVAVAEGGNEQELGGLTTDMGEGCIVTWQEYRAGNWHIYAQRIDSDGERLWNPSGVAISDAPADKVRPRITSDGLGGAVITWQDQRNGSWDIYVQRVDSNGKVKWAEDGVCLCDNGAQQEYPMITTDGSSGAIVAWRDIRSGDFDVYVRRVNSGGQPQWSDQGVVICDSAGEQHGHELVSDGAGGAIVTWSDKRSGSYDIYDQRVGSNGTTMWTPNGVVICNAGGDQNKPVLTGDGSGGAVIAWEDMRGGLNYDIYTQKTDSSGFPSWGVNGVAVCDVGENQVEATIAYDGSGGAVMAWQDQRSGSSFDIYLQRVDSGGTPQLGEDGIEVSVEEGDQINPAIAGDDSGGGIVTWQDKRQGQWDVFAQWVDSAGNPEWSDDGTSLCGADGDQTLPDIVSDGAGGAIVAWDDDRSASTDVYTQRVLDYAQTWYLAEGATLGGFETWVLVQNPGPGEAEATVTYQTDQGEVPGPNLKLQPGTRTTVNVSDTVQTYEVSTKVTSDNPVIVERAMYYNNRTCAHDSIGVTAPAKTWYLAEGASLGGFECWVLVQNPGPENATVQLTYQTSEGQVGGPVLALPPGTRETVNVADVVQTYDVSTRADSDVPVIAERAMYFGGRSCAHDSIGVTTPAQTWYLAEGSTYGGFETWVLVQNPGQDQAHVQLTYQTPHREIAGPNLALLPGTRQTVNVADTISTYEVSTKVTSDKPVIAERSMYYNSRTCAHDSIGVTFPAKTWYLAEGATEGGFETWVLIQNPSEQTATATVTFQTDKGEVPGPTVTIEPNTRQTLNVGDTVVTYMVSTKVSSDVPVIVERAMYYNHRTCAHDSIGYPAP